MGFRLNIVKFYLKIARFHRAEGSSSSLTSDYDFHGNVVRFYVKIARLHGVERSSYLTSDHILN